MVLFFCLLLSQGRFASCEEQTKRYVLDNGLIVLLRHIPNSQEVAIEAVVRAGSVTEGKYLGSGISHFIEHMLFKGTAKRGAGRISEDVRSLGGIINASTSFDYTFYAIELPTGTQTKGLEILTDMLMHPLFDPQQVEKERGVILGEVRLHHDSPQRRVSDLVFQNVYTRHPYRHPIIGYEPLFKMITRDDLLDYYHTHYVPNNMILTVAGDIRVDEVLNWVKELFKDFKPHPYALRNLPVEPPQLSSRRYEEEYPTKIAYLDLVFRGVSLAHQDMFAMDVLAIILGHGESSRLYREVFKNRQLVYSIAASNFTPMDQGVFEVSCALEEKNVDEAIRTIQRQIEIIKKNGVTPSELEKAKRQVLSGFYFGRQTPADIAEDAALNEAFIGDFNFSEKYVQAIKQITGKDIKRVANQYLNEQSLTVVLLKTPSAHKETTGSVSPEKPITTQKISLDNGMVILLREDHAQPLVSIRLALRGGLLEETVQTAGLSNLTARLWVQGTSSRPADKIAESSESMGMRLGSFSGRNSLGLSFDFLSPDMNFAISLLEDVVKNPVFPASELAKDKEPIKSGIREREDDVMDVTLKNLKENLFAGHPYSWDELGTLGSIDNLNRQDIAAFYKKLCVPNNMVLSIFGDFDSKKIAAVIKNKFAGLKRQNLNLYSAKEPLPQVIKEKAATLDKEQSVVAVGFRGPSLNSDERYGVELFTSVLGSALSGRIFTKIRDELGRAYTLGGGFTPGIETGTIYFYAATTLEHVEKVKQILLEQIKEIQTNGISAQELEDTKAYLKGTHQMGLITNAALALRGALDELYGLGFDDYTKYNARLDRLSREEILKLAQAYLNLEKAAVVITKSSQNKSVSAPDIYIYNDIRQ